MIIILYIASKWIGFTVPWWLWIIAAFDSVTSMIKVKSRMPTIKLEIKPMEWNIKLPDIKIAKG